MVFFILRSWDQLNSNNSCVDELLVVDFNWCDFTLLLLKSSTCETNKIVKQITNLGQKFAGGASQRSVDLESLHQGRRSDQFHLIK